ncbi:MAG: hypothetical protein QGH60_09900 [Phycisphaerae bacterium]|jgi:hypothetical protein|nr:hypothetical protein [Phycisphaerae bacterium]
MKKITSTAAVCWVVCSSAILLHAASPAKHAIPFPKALLACDVTLKTMNNGNTESLMLGNGDLYGVVWRKGGGLFMRITKNDIWDARVDTSNDGPLPKVDIATGKITGSRGTSPSYKKLYPQPRCAAALRFGGTGDGGISWDCIRRTHANALTPTKDHRGASIKVAGRAEASNGYRAILPGNPVISSFRMKLKGSQNASYYIDLFDSTGKPVKKVGWLKSPADETEIKLDLEPTRINNIVIYTMTSDGRPAFNHVHSLQIRHKAKKTPLTFEALETENLHGHLDITKAVASINLRDAKPTQIRILHDRNVVLMHTADTVAIEPIKAATLPAAKTGRTGEVTWLLMKMPGDIDYKGMEYAIALASRGDLKAASLVTSWDIKTGDVLTAAMTLASQTLKQEESKLIAAHEQAWEEFWSRSGVALGDEVMQRWWYRMLYFAKTVCKPGAAPVALMPPLATDSTPWHGDIHHNYNAWQAFWPLPAANHSELADPWISYVDGMLPRFKYLARVTYDIDGVFFPISSFLHEPDPAACKSKNKRQVSLNPWGLTIGLVGMTIQSMWQKHLCDPDPKYLKAKIYPTLRQGALFYTSFMDKCKKDDSGKKSKIRLGPSYSPEHGSAGIYNCPFDIAYVHYTFDAFIQAAGELNVDKDLAAKCRKYKALLPDYPTAMDKSGKPVVVDWSGCRYRQVPRHNIEVPASPVFPGDQVTWFSPEPVKELFRRTIRDTRRTGDNSHIMFNIARARLSMPEGFTQAKKWFSPRELPNGFIAFPWAHGTFMQEQIGLTGLVNEFLLQSVSRKIRVFPCWPADKDAAFAGLRAEGGFVVSAERKDGKVVKLEIVAPNGGKLQLLSPWKTIKANGKVLVQDKRGMVTLDTQKNERLVFAEGK